MDKLTKVQDKLSQLKGVRDSVQKELNTLTEHLDNKKRTLEIFNEAISLARKCIEKRVGSKQYLEQLVSSALTDVFGIPYVFVLKPVMDQLGDLKGLEPLVSINGKDYEQPYDDDGGGSHSIISVCLQIGIILLTPGIQKFIYLDEPVADLSSDLQSRFYDWISTICEETGLQIMMVTHHFEQIGKVYKLELDYSEDEAYTKYKVINNG